MKIHSVCDPEFHRYGQVISGMEEPVREILSVLQDTPLPQGVEYVGEYAPLQQLPAMKEIRNHLYGGMPVQLGWCNGHNTKLNCLEYHRDSEFNLGTEDFILLLARQEEIADGMLDTSCVRAFRVPAGVMVEIFATTLHYAPCHCNPRKGFRVLVVLPQGTNGEKPCFLPKTMEDYMLTARNKWLLAHRESAEAAAGARVGLTGKNLDIAELI